jgi:hypothetical protein
LAGPEECSQQGTQKSRLSRSVFHCSGFHSPLPLLRRGRRSPLGRAVDGFEFKGDARMRGNGGTVKPSPMKVT